MKLKLTLRSLKGNSRIVSGATLKFRQGDWVPGRTISALVGDDLIFSPKKSQTEIAILHRDGIDT
jgi:hypothetical protein